MADVDEKTKKARAERREKLLAWYEEKDLPRSSATMSFASLMSSTIAFIMPSAGFTSRMDGRSASYTMRKRRITW